MIQSVASSLYGALVTWRRRWYARNPSRRRRLARPVISVGNLRAGGSGKTPTVGYIASLLLSRGQRPVILTRGYARRAPAPGVTVVSDGASVLATLDAAGDEPLMLARALPGVPVLVGSDRYASGQLAESRFGATVHLLDDGFQHLALARDVDLLLVSEDDLSDRTLPAGRLREPLSAGASADAVIVPAETDEIAARVGRALGIKTVFRLRRAIGWPRPVVSDATAPRAGATPAPDMKLPVFAVAAIARPDRFFGDLRSAGWTLAGTMTFGDHHAFSRADVDRIIAAACAAGAGTVVTTEKDAVRLEGHAFGGLALAAVPLAVSIEPAEGFASWLLHAIDASGGAAASRP